MTTNVILGLLLIAAAAIILADRLFYLLWRIIRFQRLRPELQVGTLPSLRRPSGAADSRSKTGGPLR